MLEEKKDTVVPKEKWEFDEEVTAAFEDMLSRSIPDYKGMRKLVLDMTLTLKPSAYKILDIGASRGDSLFSLVDKYCSGDEQFPHHFVAIEPSEAMVEVIREKAERIRATNNKVTFDILQEKVQDSSAFAPAFDGTYSIIHSILTLMFTPIEYRVSILEKIYNALEPNGVFILVEKVLGSTGVFDDALVHNYYQFKKSNGYSEEDIKRKKKSLSGIQVPLTSAWNEEMLAKAGFNKVECFWRNLNFVAYCAIK